MYYIYNTLNKTSHFHGKWWESWTKLQCSVPEEVGEGREQENCEEKRREREGRRAEGGKQAAPFPKVAHHAGNWLRFRHMTCEEELLHLSPREG